MMQNKEIHYRYAISYLLSTIILLVALAYYDVPNLVDKFSFALTLSSLLLAILAIFYTIISANKQDSQFSKILEATSKLGISVTDISEASTAISKLTKDIPTHFETINSRIGDIQDTYKSLSEIENKREFDSKDKENPEEVSFKKVLAPLHFNGMAVLYWFTVASFKSKSIDYSEFQEFEMANIDYAIGFLNAFEATGLIDFKLHKESIIPTRCDKALYNNYKNELEKIIKIINEESSKKLSDSIKWVDEKYI